MVIVAQSTFKIYCAPPSITSQLVLFLWQTVEIGPLGHVRVVEALQNLGLVLIFWNVLYLYSSPRSYFVSAFCQKHFYWLRFFLITSKYFISSLNYLNQLVIDRKKGRTLVYNIVRERKRTHVKSKAKAMANHSFENAA